MKKRYIKTAPLDPVKPKKKDMAQQDKEARLYELAEKLKVKIGGNK